MTTKDQHHVEAQAIVMIMVQFPLDPNQVITGSELSALFSERDELKRLVRVAATGIVEEREQWLAERLSGEGERDELRANLDRVSKALAAVKRRHDELRAECVALAAERNDFQARLYTVTIERDELRAALVGLLAVIPEDYRVTITSKVERARKVVGL